jgi:deoxycytidylate deaminase
MCQNYTDNDTDSIELYPRKRKRKPIQLNIARISNRRQNILQLLAEEALKSTMQHQVSACIVNGDSIVSIGHNKHVVSGGIRISCFYIERTIHAEVDAIYRLIKKYGKTATQKILKRATLYVARIGVIPIEDDTEKCLNHTRITRLERLKHQSNDERDTYFKYSKPCKGCQKYIRHFQIPRIYYTQ